MKLSNILKYFIPKERKFYGMFNLAADNIIEASVEFKKLINAPSFEERKEIGKRIKAIERKGDDFTYHIFEELHKTFITPFDREDIHELTSTMDDVVDLIHGVAGKIEYYHCANISGYMKEMVALVHEGCIQIQIAIKGLQSMKNDKLILRACKELNIIESKCDAIYHQAISDLFENEKEPIELIKQKEIHHSIEKIVNKMEDISDVVKTILIKYA